MTRIDDLKRRRRSAWIDGLIATLLTVAAVNMALAGQWWWWVPVPVAAAAAVADAAAVAHLGECIRLLEGNDASS